MAELGGFSEFQILAVEEDCPRGVGTLGAVRYLFDLSVLNGRRLMDLRMSIYAEIEVLPLKAVLALVACQSVPSEDELEWAPALEFPTVPAPSPKES